MPTQKSSGGAVSPQTPGQSCDPQTRPQGRALSLRLPERVPMPVLPAFFPAQPGAS